MDPLRSSLKPWRKPAILIGVGVLVYGIYSLFGNPEARWERKKRLHKRVAVVDYSVPFEDYREHQAVHWLLNHLKLSNNETNNTWDPALDYTGYKPTHRKQPQRLSSINESDFDLVFVSDTYGVYEDDLKNIATKTSHMNYSKVVFGGLSLEDANAIEHLIENKKQVICEFNCFGTPTNDHVSSQVQRALDVTWTEWTGHVFSDPSDAQVVPHWFPVEFKKQFPTRSFPVNPMLLFVHKSGELKVFESDAIGDLLPRVKTTDNFPVKSTPTISFPFTGWFSMSTVNDQGTALAEFDFSNHPPIGNWLASIDLNDPMVAISQTKNGFGTYLAGDFTNNADDLGPYNTVSLIASKQKWANELAGVHSAALFWNVYIPFVKHMLLQ